MPNAIQRRRGTTSAHAVFTGLVGELTVDTDKKTLVVHDGVTAGGTPLATAASVTAAAVTAVQRTSTTGSMQVPSGTTAQRDGTPVYGGQRANSTLNQQEWWNGSAWVPMGGGATGAPGNNVFVENDQTVTANYTLTANKNASSAGPITIANGVIVTVPNGAFWSIV